MQYHTRRSLYPFQTHSSVASSDVFSCYLLQGRDDFDRLLFDLTKEGLFEFSDLPTDKPVRENWVLVLYSYIIFRRYMMSTSF